MVRDAEQDHRCALCGTQRAEGQSTERYATLDLCGSCFAGEFGQRLEPRGIRVQQLAFATRSRGENKTRRDYVLVNGTIDRELPLRASFSREDLLSKIGKLFRPELKVGDPLFDDAVLIRTDDADALARLLRAEGLQAVIHGAVTELAEHQLPLLLEGQRVQLLSQTTPSAAGDDLLRRIVAIVLHHLWLDAEAQQAARAKPPLLDFEQAFARLVSGHAPLIGVYLKGDRLDDLTALAQLLCAHNELRSIGLFDLRLTSPDLAPLSQIEGLRWLSLTGSEGVTDLTGLAHAATLRHLDLCGCSVVDLAPLCGLTALEELNIRDTEVSDLRSIEGCRALKRLDARRSKVPQAELERLREANPELQIDATDAAVGSAGSTDATGAPVVDRSGSNHVGEWDYGDAVRSK